MPHTLPPLRCRPIPMGLLPLVPALALSGGLLLRGHPQDLREAGPAAGDEHARQAPV